MQAKASTHRSRSKDRKGRVVTGPKGPPRGQTKIRPTGKALIPVWHGPVIPMTLNDRVLGIFRAYCRSSRLSRAELARRAGKDRQWLHRLLTDVKVCNLDTMGCICNCMRCAPSYLVSIAEDTPANRARV